MAKIYRRGSLASAMSDRSGPLRPDGLPIRTTPPVKASKGMVCASQPEAAKIGLKVLKRGGSAVDAAIATNAALGLVEPTGCGVGGDLFALGWDAEAEKLWAYNGSGRSPSGLTLDDLLELPDLADETSLPAHSALAVSVPGCVEGWFAIHERHGQLPIFELLRPSSDLARRGFKVTPVIAHHWQRAGPLFRHIRGFGATYLPQGKAPVQGQRFRNPDLAGLYDKLATEGADYFYQGPPAHAISLCVEEAGGFLTVEDLAVHKGEWVRPQFISYRDYEVWELGPNSQGLAALQMLGLVGDHDLTETGALSASAIHLMVEAKKLAYADLARYVCDPAFGPPLVDSLLSEEYLSSRRALIEEDRAGPIPMAGNFALSGGDTVYLTTADREGNLVSWIQSNYMGFGTGLVPEGPGFSLQNRGALFSLDPQHPNCYAPGKRPFHTLIPAMVTRGGKPVFSFGVMGGDFQPQGHLQILTNILDLGMDVQAAGAAPRWMHVGSQRPTDPLSGKGDPQGGELLMEPGFDLNVMEALAAKGHRVRLHNGAGGEFGGYQGLWVGVGETAGKREYTGTSEPRKDGLALGY